MLSYLSACKIVEIFRIPTQPAYVGRKIIKRYKKIEFTRLFLVTEFNIRLHFVNRFVSVDIVTRAPDIPVSQIRIQASCVHTRFACIREQDSYIAFR